MIARIGRIVLLSLFAIAATANAAGADGAIQGKYCHIPPADLRLDFALPVYGTTDAQMSLADLKGHPVWINFFASWCAPCRAEASHVEEFAKKMKGSGLRVVGIDLRESDAKVTEYRTTFGIDYPILLDRKAALFHELGFRGIPSHIFIDAEGRITCSVSGALDWHQIDNETAVILGERDSDGDVK